MFKPLRTYIGHVSAHPIRTYIGRVCARACVCMYVYMCIYTIYTIHIYLCILYIYYIYKIWPFINGKIKFISAKEIVINVKNIFILVNGKHCIFCIFISGKASGHASHAEND